MQIEIHHVGPEMALLDNDRPELWVRVLSDEPLSPSYWDELRKQLVADDDRLLDGYARTSVHFYDDFRDDEQRKSEGGFEQWWVVQSLEVGVPNVARIPTQPTGPQAVV